MNVRQMRDRQVTVMKMLLCQCLRQRQPLASGFTLVELLVALIIGSILTLLLLFAAVQLMGTNQREASRSDTQREMQAAIDYISRDLREAVYVYDGQCLSQNGLNGGAAGTRRCPGLLQFVPGGLNTTTNLPVLAFWRLDPLPEAVVAACRNNPSAELLSTANCYGQKMYTLVVYSLNTQNAAGTWRGRARITRYTLPQYSFNGNPIVGWYSPLTYSFERWPTDPDPLENEKTPPPQSGQANNIEGNNQVLVDFADNAQSIGATPPAGTNFCPGGAVANPGFQPTPDPTGGGYAATAISRLPFHACVRGAGASNLNQEVVVRLTGNVAGRPGLSANANVPITMETRVLTRGVLNK